MKNLLKLSKLTFLLFVGFSIQSCSDDDDDVTTPTGPSNIVEIAMDTPDLSNLVAALSVADGNLVDVLSGGEFTVLAPTNEAFETFLAANGFMSLSEVPTDVLSNILLNHVISGTVNSTNLVDAGSGYSTTNASNMDGDNLSLYFDTSSGVTFNGISSVVAADIVASNGIVHVVDEVIGLPTVVTFAVSNPALSTLVAALTTEGLSVDIVSILSSSDEPSPFTVFAPTNDAFGSLLAELGLNALGDIPVDILEATLGTHVAPEANVRSTDLVDGMSVNTIGSTITVSLSDGAKLIDSNGRESNIVAVDIQAYNGVVHVIDNVLLP
ncbi:fasciclin domain-containing protein [Flavobacteriaceae bacterium]|nr:fasciclin domain-containing protein [Flavobacteriaceae bacterium]MDA9029726.1 fasciclin domain-containing protein [Flavobacteriaceae bacterium]|tara:strand:+ start:166 stop:1140 length:975 start_codon:yes stop_codon:yes gene_type:complete